MRCVKPSSATDCPSWTWRPIASANVSSCIALLDYGLRLLAHVLGQVVERGDRLAGVARALPTGEGLIARPGPSGGTLRSVDVGHPGLDALVKPGDLLARAIEPGRKPEWRPVRELHRLLVGGHAMHHENREK